MLLFLLSSCVKHPPANEAIYISSFPETVSLSSGSWTITVSAGMNGAAIALNEKDQPYTIVARTIPSVTHVLEGINKSYDSGGYGTGGSVKIKRMEKIDDSIILDASFLKNGSRKGSWHEKIYAIEQSNRVFWISDIKVKAEQDFELSYTREVIFTGDTGWPFFLVPGYLYGSNNDKHAKDVFPRLIQNADISSPTSSFFSFRADRSSHLTSMMSNGSNWAGIAIDEGVSANNLFFYNGLALGRRPGGTSPCVCATLGYSNIPARYNGNCGSRAPRWESETEYKPVKLKSGDEINFRFILFAGKGKSKFDSEPIIEGLYKIFHKKPKFRNPPYETIRDVAGALVNDGIVKPVGLWRVIDNSDECDTGWTGGPMVSTAVLKAGIKMEKEELIKDAIKSIDTLCSEGLNDKSGFLYDTWKKGEWTTEGWWVHWSGGAHLAYTNGQAVYYILKAYEIMKSHGREPNPMWIEISKRVLESAEKTQRENGAFPVTFSSEDGSPVSWEGFAGCWFVPAMAILGRLTNNNNMIESAIKGEAYYYEWLKTYELWGSPIDASNAVDEEGNIALAIGEWELYKATEDKNYIEHLDHSLRYDFTWKWAYRSYTANPPLSRLDFDTTGGNGTSCCNIHLHQMGGLLAEPISYMAENSEYYYSRYLDTIIFSIQSASRIDGEFGFGRKGWVTEQFYHTDAVQGALPYDGGLWPRYLPWAAASVLHTLLVEDK